MRAGFSRFARASLAAAWVAGTAGCAGHSAALGRAPLAGDDLSARARLLLMADARRVDSTLILSSLDGGRASTVRAAAALAAGQVGARNLAPRLRMLLADGDTSVAAGAAFALGLLRDTAGVDALAATFAGGGPVAREAAWALGEVGEPARAAIETLLQWLRAPHADAASRALALPRTVAAFEMAQGASRAGPRERAALLLAAQRLRPVPVELLLPHLAARDDVVDSDHPAERPSWAAAYALTRTPAPAATRALLGLAATPDAEVRALVASGLRRAATGDSLAAAALAALTVLARDADAHVRINAVRALGSHGAAARAALVPALGDRDRNVRVAAAQSAARVVADSAEWERFWAADTTFMVRRSLLAGATQSAVALTGGAEWSRSADWRLRMAAAEAAAGAPLPVVRATVPPLLRDPDGRVRAAALGVIGAWADSASAPDARAAVRAALEDADFYARATALHALGTSASASEVPAVLRSYARARADSANDARLAAIAYLAAAWRRDSLAFGDSLRTTLASLAAPADPLERQAASGITPLRGWSGRAADERDLGWYRAVLAATLQRALSGRPPMAHLVTERGEIVIELFGVDAPLTVDNFMMLARSGFYRDTRFHRVVPNFVAQDGDPRGDGNGSPGWSIRDELNRRRYARGAVGMALSGPDTGGSQYFLALSPQPHLDGHYTVFGRVVGGWDAMDALVQGDRILRVDVR